MGLNNRLTRLEREERAGKPKSEPIPREDVHALDTIADLKRDGCFDASTPIAELVQMMVGRGVEETVARRFGAMMEAQEAQDEEASNRHGPRSWR